VADGSIDVTERQLYTFTNKFGNKFVPVDNNANLAKPAIKTYSKISDLSGKKTKNKTDPKQDVNNTINNTINNTTVNTTSQILNSNSNKTEATVIATVTVPVTNVTIPVTTVAAPAVTPPVQISIPSLESSFSLDLPQFSTSQMQDSMEEPPSMLLESDEFVNELIGREVEGIEKQNQLYFSDEGYSGSVSGNSSPTSCVEDYTTLHAMETEDAITTNTVPELHLPEVNFQNLDDIEIDLLDSNLDSVLLGTFESVPQMLNAFSSEKNTTNEEQPKNDEVSKRHRKGPKRQEMENIPAKNRSNVERCRVYRKNKKEKELDYQDELMALESRNDELVKKEQRMKDELVRLQSAYLKLISEGRIKFA